MFRFRFVCIGLAIAAILGVLSGLPAAAAAPAVTIEAGKTAEPISDYVYGEFIEHQGRCIYGGIWAEMLEDRKFYYPINFYFPWGKNKNKSPWKPIGFDTIVVMSKENSYVGEHTPQINLDGKTPRGIMQGDLALRKAKKYKGRIVLAGDGSVKVKVSLVWGPRIDDKQTITISNLTNEYKKTPLSFTAGVDNDYGRLEIVGSGEGTFYIGTVSLMPGDNIQGMRADSIKLLKELNATTYRWPGGSFVAGYNWRDGIGERDKRPPRINHAYWSEDIESNDFGCDEFITFCRVLNTEPYMVVNTLSDDEHSAAAEVEYFNGSPETPMGKLRAANGHRQPYNVKWWGVGNETWFTMPLEEYIRRYNLFAKAMLKADPSVKLIAVGAYGDMGQKEDDWSERILKNCSQHMALISEHYYGFPQEGDSVWDHAQHVLEGIKMKAAGHRNYRDNLEELRGKDIRICLDEWNYFWYGQQLYGEAAPRYPFKDALAIAGGFHEIYRSSDIIFMANIHPINVHGGVKTTKTDATLATTGLVFKLYRQHFGNLPVAVTGDAKPLDVVAAWNKKKKALTIGIVNAAEKEYELAINFKDAKLAGTAKLWVIAGSDPMAYNEPGAPPQVVIEEKKLSGISNKLSAPPLSISLYELSAQ